MKFLSASFATLVLSVLMPQPSSANTAAGTLLTNYVGDNAAADGKSSQIVNRCNFIDSMQSLQGESRDSDYAPHLALDFSWITVTVVASVADSSTRDYYEEAIITRCKVPAASTLLLALPEVPQNLTAVQLREE